MGAPEQIHLSKNHAAGCRGAAHIACRRIGPRAFFLLDATWGRPKRLAFAMLGARSVPWFFYSLAVPPLTGGERDWCVEVPPAYYFRCWRKKNFAT